MLATPERVVGRGRTPDRTIWHKPGSGHRCAGNCDFHPIACSEEEGIVAPAPNRDIPLRLDVEHETWCGDCLTLIRQQRTNAAQERS
ncbi:hypothetical protein OG384_04325 [Streptomyces sp. NBC_01324]|uniref:hypothetical protein n=1 Tax=Streptomyces sp. NBC_01324 TaxID=2903826 RepID=UPI002E168106|nr:hypothetical protein OG384_04325 [Streptomyces sp. NBC_01324]